MIPVAKDRPVLLDPQDLRVILVLQERMDLKVIQELPAPPVHKAQQVHKVLSDQKDQKDR